MRQLALAGLLVVVFAVQALSAQPEEVHRLATQAAQLRRQAQEILSSWQERKAQILARIAALNQERKLLNAQLKRLETYLHTEQAKLHALEAQLEALEKLKHKLEPLVVDKARRLKELLGDSPPPVAEASRARIEALEQTLNDYDASVVAKTKALLVALEAEARQGITARALEKEVLIAGRRLRVQLLVLGRVGVFALGMGGSQAWVWERGKGAFVAVDEYAGEIKRAIEMAARRRVVELVELPIGPARAEKSR